MNNIAIIPARGGSKRIPRKNIRNFLGKPIIAYSIEIAIKSGLFSEVMVSTDDDEIAEVAIKYGAKVPFLRSSLNSNDYATTFDVIDEVIGEYEENNLIFENICCIYSCAPLILKSNIIEAYELLLKNNYDSVFPIVKYSTPIQRALKFEKNRVLMANEGYEISRSQDLESYYFDAGQFYWLKKNSLTINKKIFTNNSGAIILSDLYAQDIDNETDWKTAEMKYKLINY
jgi:N-acylneuraminate cytidylyltransferase